MLTNAITRLPGKNFAKGITTADLGRPDYGRLLEQHTAYVETLRSLELEVVVLEPLPDYPDAYFVEDVAIIAPEFAIITRPGVASRQGETAHITAALEGVRNLIHIEEPGTLDGGDVLVIDSHAYIGVAQRTNALGAVQFGTIWAGHGAKWTAVAVTDGLHLKSSVSYVGHNTILVTEAYAAHPAFAKHGKIVLDEDEHGAANSLFINNHILMPAGFPKTRAKLEQLDLPIIELDVSEAQKMDGGLSCMSLRMLELEIIEEDELEDEDDLDDEDEVEESKV